MIIVLKPQCSKEQLENFSNTLQDMYHVKVNSWVGTQSTVLGLIGDTSVAVSYTHLDVYKRQP